MQERADSGGFERSGLGGPSAGVEGAPARMMLPGALGALLEKDLRVAWRDPALKATVLMSMAFSTMTASPTAATRRTASASAPKASR